MARLFARIAALVLGISAFAAADAQTYTYTFYVGNTNASGCTVSTPAGPVDHVKWRLQATVTAGVSPQFGSVSRADCADGNFGSPSAVTSTSAIGLNTGTGGADVIEVRLPIGVVGPTPSPREVLALVASSDSASDALINTAMTKGLIGQPQTPAVIPSLGAIAALLLGLALLGVGWYALRRYAQVWPLALLLVAGTAWAVSIVIDGQVGDWATVTPSTDPAGDVSVAALDLRAMYATTQGSDGYLRVDVVDLQNPPIANPGSATVLEDGNVTITLTGSDPGAAPLTFQISTPPTVGGLSAITPIDATSASVVYTPNPDEFGADSFSFTVNNGTQTSTPASVAITITPVNDAPSFTAVDPPTVNEGSGANSVPGWASFDPGPANESSQAVLEYVVSAIGNPGLFSVPPAVAANGTLSYTLAAQANGSSSFSVAVRDDGGIANGGVDLSATQSFTITVNAVNAAPSFVGGGDESALEDAGAQTVTGWATAIDDGDPEASQGLSFSISANGNPGLFASGPSVDPITGNLSYTPAADANGTAALTLVLSDDGGVANGGSDTSTPYNFNVQVTPVNDAPSFTAVDPPAVDEGSGTQTVPNWAAFDPGPANESTQAALEYLVSAIGNPALFAVAPSVDANGTLTYTVAPNVSGSSTFSVAVRDDGGIANGGVDLSASQVFTVTVNAVNSAPSFVGGGDVASDEDAGPQSFAGWATAIGDGDLDQVQTLTFNVTGNTNPALFSAGPSVDAVSGNLSYTAATDASGSATITLTLSDDGGIANGGSDTSAPYNFTITVNPVNDAPTATAKAHATHSAIELEIVAASHSGELLEGAADADDPIGDLTAVFVAGSATPAGAQVTVTNASDGSFRYDPPGGYSGAGSFQFKICDDGVPAAPQQCSAATTVSFTITGPDLYFVDDNAAPGGDGGLNDPFDALSDLPAGRGNNDRIFVLAGSYPAAVHSFFVGEHLVGQGASGAFDTVFGVTIPANGALDARPALTGVLGDRPALNRIVMAGATGATMRGVALSTASSESVFINGTTGVTISESSAASSISGVKINNSSASAEGVTFTNVTSTGGVNGIVLNNLTGSFDFGVGSLAGNTGVSFLATGTLGTTTYGGSITKTTGGNLVEISGAATGTVTLSGNLSCSGSCAGIDVVNRGAGAITFSGATKALNTGANAAVNLDNNDAATISFTGGGLDIDTTGGAGFNAINGAVAVSVQGAGNTIGSASGVGLNVANTTIGAAGLTFERISSIGGAGSGIVLNATGSDGGLTVTGSGGACTSSATCSGGTISGKSSSGVVLTSTRDVSLHHMLIDANAGSGILGTELTDFSFIAGRVTGNGDTADGSEANLRFGRLMGECAIDASVVSGSSHDELRLTPDAGVLTSFDITGTSFGPSGGFSGNGITVLATGNSDVSMRIDNGVFQQLANSGVSSNGTDTSRRVLEIVQSEFSDNANGVNLLGGLDADLTYTIADSSFLRHAINPVQVLSSSTSTNASQWIGEISGVSIGDGSPDSGAQDLHGIAIEMNGDADSIQSITGNSVSNTDIDAIFVQARLDNDADSQIGRHDFAVVDNNSGTPDDNSAFPFMIVYGNRIESRNTTAMCLNMAGNNAGSVGGLEHFRLRQRDTSSFRFERLTDGDGTPNEVINAVATIEAHIAGQNDAGSTADATLVAGFTEAADQACRTP